MDRFIWFINPNTVKNMLGDISITNPNTKKKKKKNKKKKNQI